MSTNDVFHIGWEERVCCYYCQRDQNHTDYGHGEAFLAGPGHSPCDGNSNYICRKHLDDGAVIYEPFPTRLGSAFLQADSQKGEGDA